MDQKGYGTVSILCMAWALAQNGLDPSTKFVLTILADHANDDGVCWPGQKGIAAKVGITERQVQRHIAKLRDSGFISTERLKRDDGSLSVNRYTLKLPKMSGAPDIQYGSDPTWVSGHEPSIEPPTDISVCVPQVSMSGGARREYGEFHSVFLTDDEVGKLRVRLNGSFYELLEELDMYSQTHPAKFKAYKNHYATLLSWHQRRQKGLIYGKERRTYESKAEQNVRETREASERLLARMSQQARGRFPDESQ